MRQFWIAAACIAVLVSCSKKTEQGIRFTLSPADSAHVVGEILAHRLQVDSVFQSDPESPFVKDTAAHFHGIRWYPPDVRFFFQSKLFRYEKAETVTVYGTKGDARQQLKFGYFVIPYGGREHHLNVYKFTSADPERYEAYKNYLSVWFTDSTTGKETYNVGRYMDVGEQDPDPNHVYIIDFNTAYNPYCAYSNLFSCTIPRKEDRLEIAVRAGELKYHQ